jgi:OmpA-OmpF porin, OOP family
MKRAGKLLAAIAALAAATPALAQETGFYVGGALGQSSFRKACRDFDELVASQGSFNCISHEASAGKVFGGWRFHRYLAAELSYIDYGEAKATATLGTASVMASSKVQAAGLSGLGILPLGDRLSVFGRLGLLQTRTQSKATGAAAAESDHSELEMHVGIGGMLLLGRGWSLRLEFERVNDSKIDLSTLGAQYQF